MVQPCSAIWGAAVSVLLLAAQVSAGPYPAVANKPSFVAIGDGLTESAFSSENKGWGLLMQMKYVRKADIINRGFGGFFTAWFVDYMLDSLFNVGNPQLAILFLGVKDSLTPAVSGDHYISPQHFGSNIQQIIDAGKAAGVAKFLIITPPPVCEACKAKSPKPWDRENSHTAQYVQQLQQIAQQNNAAFLDIFTAWQKDPDWHNKLLLPDKLHLSSQGNEVLFNQIIKTLEQQAPEFAPSNIALHWPLMDVISKDDPAAAFSKVVNNPSSSSNTALCKGSSTSSSSNNASKKQLESGSGGGTQSLHEQQKLPAVTSAVMGLGTGGWVLLVAVVVTAWQLAAVGEGWSI